MQRPSLFRSVGFTQTASTLLIAAGMETTMFDLTASYKTEHMMSQWTHSVVESN